MIQKFTKTWTYRPKLRIFAGPWSGYFTAVRYYVSSRRYTVKLVSTGGTRRATRFIKCLNSENSKFKLSERNDVEIKCFKHWNFERLNCFKFRTLNLQQIRTWAINFKTKTKITQVCFENQMFQNIQKKTKQKNSRKWPLPKSWSQMGISFKLSRSAHTQPQWNFNV